MRQPPVVSASRSGEALLSSRLLEGLLVGRGVRSRVWKPRLSGCGTRRRSAQARSAQASTRRSLHVSIRERTAQTRRAPQTTQGRGVGRGNTLELVVTTWARTLNHRPCKDCAGRSRVKLYLDHVPTPEEIATAKAALDERLSRRHPARACGGPLPDGGGQEHRSGARGVGDRPGPVGRGCRPRYRALEAVERDREQLDEREAGSPQAGFSGLGRIWGIGDTGIKAAPPRSSEDHATRPPAAPDPGPPP